MNKKMSLMGVGGKIAIVLVISLIVTASINYLLSPLFEITKNIHTLYTTAIILIVVGFSLNLIAAFTMMHAYKKDQLATSGLYSIFLNPMYVCQIFITLPGILLFFNSWLVIITIIPTFIASKKFVKEEEKYLNNKFGSTYKDYKKKVLFKFL